MKLTIHTGSNGPRIPILPAFRSQLSYQFRLGQEWNAPFNDAGFGLKLPALGKFSYHRGGINAAISYDNGLWISPRYYEDVTTGVNLLHELTNYRVKIETDRWYRVILTPEPLMWRLDGRLLHAIDCKVPHGWITPIFLGKGTDNNYPGGYIPPSGANKELTIEIRYS